MGAGNLSKSAPLIFKYSLQHLEQHVGPITYAFHVYLYAHCTFVYTFLCARGLCIYTYFVITVLFIVQNSYRILLKYGSLIALIH